MLSSINTFFDISPIFSIFSLFSSLLLRYLLTLSAHAYTGGLATSFSPPSVCPSHPHHRINLIKCHLIMSLFSKLQGLPMVPYVLCSIPTLFPLFSDKETPLPHPSSSSVSLQLSVLMSFSKSIFAQTLL